MIPHLIHRIWVGDATMPEEYHGFWGQMAEMHPGWVLETWTDASLDWLTNRTLYEQQETPMGRADVARYEILARYGGIYVDCDTEPLRSFGELLEDVRAFAGFQDDSSIANGLMGSEPNYPPTLRLVDELPYWVSTHADQPPQQRTGPAFLTHVWKPLQGQNGLRIFPRDTFYPVHWTAKARLGGPYPEASYAVSHWGGSG